MLSPTAQWKVHVRRPGVIALQNVHTSDNWLAIRDGNTVGNVCKILYCSVICSPGLYCYREKVENSVN